MWWKCKTWKWTLRPALIMDEYFIHELVCTELLVCSSILYEYLQGFTFCLLLKLVTILTCGACYGDLKLNAGCRPLVSVVIALHFVLLHANPTLFMFLFVLSCGWLSGESRRAANELLSISLLQQLLPAFCIKTTFLDKINQNVQSKKNVENKQTSSHHPTVVFTVTLTGCCPLSVMFQFAETSTGSSLTWWSCLK